MAAQQLIPEGIQAFHPANLGDSLAIRRIGVAPERQRSDISVVAIAADAPCGDAFGDEVYQEPARCRIAEIEQRIVRADLIAVTFVEHPGWVGNVGAPVAADLIRPEVQ